MSNIYRPNDPLYSSQWHFGMIGRLGYRTDADTEGIERVWYDYTGAGVSVGIWDDGVQTSHWDLSANYDASRLVSVNGQVNNGLPISASDGHGTSVAGLIAGAANGLGGVGVAFGASYTPVRIFGGADDINSYWSRYLTTLDSLGNFDVTNHSYGGFPDFRTYGDVAKFATASATGRGGLGTINVKSAGNDNVDGNGDALDASRHTVTVAALDTTGNAAWYSTYGAHILVSAPAAAVTTDLLGSGTGYDGLLGGDYTNRFGGTSAAGPVTAGVVALMLDANAGLGWRDVHNILAYSATGTGSVYGGATTNENHAWKWNGADNWNGGGLHYSEDYGYGMVNAFNAVRMAEVWSILYPAAGTSTNEISLTTGKLTANRTIADQSTLSYAFTVAGELELEHASLTVSLTHSYFTDLRISLISPSGTRMSLYDGSTGSGSTSDYGLTYTFGLDGLRGEQAAGEWTLEIRDAARGDTGTLQSVTFTGYGKGISPDDVYHYTDEVIHLLAQSGQGGRIALLDANGGKDWINAAAMHRDLSLDLRPGAISTAGGVGFLQLDALALIEYAIGGDGDDTIFGNDADNILYGMRGSDTLHGGAGVDTAAFLGKAADYVVASADGVTAVSHTASGATDRLYGFEWLKFDDALVADPSAGIEPPPPPPPPEPPPPAPIIGTSGADVLTGTDGDDTIVGLAGNDTLSGGAGNDLLDGGVGNDSMRGGLGDDIYVVDSSRDVVSEASNEGVDAVRTTLASYTLGNHVENLEYIGSAAFTGTGNALANRIDGGAGGDRLSGAAGNDSLQGHDGADTLIGGLGNDILVGGEGADTFRFDSALNSTTNVDTIADFLAGVDKIRLENSIFKSLRSTGTLSSANFVAGAGVRAGDANDFILYDTASGDVYYDADGSGRTAPILFVNLVSAPLLQASDFLIT